jgi:hypothetical protein
MADTPDAIRMSWAKCIPRKASLKAVATVDQIKTAGTAYSRLLSLLLFRGGHSIKEPDFLICIFTFLGF